MFLVTRYSGLEVYGAWVILNTLQTLFTRLVSLPTNEVLFNFMARDKSDSKGCHGLIALVLGTLVDLLSGLGILLMVYAGYDLLNQTFLDGAVEKVSVITYFLYALALSIRSTASAYLTSIGKYQLSVSFGILEQIARLFLLLGLYFILKRDTLQDLLIASLISSVPVSVALLFHPVLYLLKNFGKLKAIVWIEALSSYFRFAKHSYTSITINGVSKTADNLLVSILFDNNLVGLYATAKQFSLPITMATAPVLNLAYPVFAEYAAAGLSDKIKGLISKTYAPLLGYSSAMVVVMLFSFHIYGAIQQIMLTATLYTVAFIALLTSAIGSLTWWARPLATAIDPKLGLQAQLLFLILYSALVYPLSSGFGIAGFATSSFLSQLLIYFYWRWRLNDLVYKKEW